MTTPSESMGALEGLPSQQQRGIELACFGAFTDQQMAELLRLPAGTVKGRRRLGSKKLRLPMGEQTGVAS